jgi:NADPH:quinone reductase-like Zn-dependent oxidoreductase
MTRTLQLLLVIAAALPAAGCTAWAMAAKHAEIKRIKQDWGVHKPDPFNPNNIPNNG